MQHVFQSALPFGGVGNSGFGRYHGDEGFKAFSVARGVYVAPRLDALRVLRPPNGNAFRRVVGLLSREWRRSVSRLRRRRLRRSIGRR
jgi:coniferyl-aldehyde dehydrogenase